ncbi:5-formyltetrahydrofolate cyclo-ligase [Ileibacterium valens]|uniref:5-formyltetrahydrofolate cyclo-ligase n=1 Tax=Ileibacterium valens TaxID=1862668 RepID=A0A1U7NET3_9FIRM|nr:5-formyltetrahydrofolate cyclo-ligase [Ileibacterium valens]OLU38339.1 5-formyltetrahydrofolate cyclo-ligase [Ileibacterium valens]OLU38485.1 5-formyltetrahydrofolate cyclo-ligase [Erysipelotrichaceae bacterium NYU-BL-E8]OLU38518.1 5-formyltetrahydrofolate cyclo-ligase [Erysipelotrichaceae bacterium NYU-BL-F16]
MNTNSEFDKERQKENQKIRQEALKIRNRILDRSQKEKALVKNLMPFFAHASRPGFFIPFRDEPDLSGLFKMVPDYLVPKVISKTEMIFWKPENLKKQVFGVIEPFSKEIEAMMNHWVTEQEMEEFRQRYVPDVLLVPLSAFFNTYRLGYGGGYYDRYLANHPEIITIGVAFDEQEMAFYPMPWDQVLDYIVTPTRIIEKKQSEESRKGN